MAATLIDEREDDVAQENEPQEQPTLEEVVDTADSQVPDQQDQAPEGGQEDSEEIPEKYRNKSLQELVQMHQEAEKAIGKQGNEVGELRKLVDTYIQSQLEGQQRELSAPAQDEPEEVDWFSDPDKALQNRLDNDPRIKAAEKWSTESRKQAAQAMLQQKHPDMKDILSDNGFAEWIQKSKIRTQLFVQADQQYDAEAADELFSLWKERKGVADQTLQVEKQARKQATKAANTGSGRGSDAPSSRKVYRRADIIKLMQTDPDRYDALAPEIFQAYKEGRVK